MTYHLTIWVVKTQVWLYEWIMNAWCGFDKNMLTLSKENITSQDKNMHVFIVIIKCYWMPFVAFCCSTTLAFLKSCLFQIQTYFIPKLLRFFKALINISHYHNESCYNFMIYYKLWTVIYIKVQIKILGFSQHFTDQI